MKSFILSKFHGNRPACPIFCRRQPTRQQHSRARRALSAPRQRIMPYVQHGRNKNHFPVLTVRFAWLHAEVPARHKCAATGPRWSGGASSRDDAGPTTIESYNLVMYRIGRRACLYGSKHRYRLQCPFHHMLPHIADHAAYRADDLLP